MVWNVAFFPCYFTLFFFFFFSWELARFMRVIVLTFMSNKLYYFMRGDAKSLEVTNKERAKEKWKSVAKHLSHEYYQFYKRNILNAHDSGSFFLTISIYRNHRWNHFCLFPSYIVQHIVTLCSEEASKFFFLAIFHFLFIA